MLTKIKRETKRINSGVCCLKTSQNDRSYPKNDRS